MHYLDPTWLDPKWAEAFTQNQMGSFEAIWDLKLSSVDAGNVGRGGKSWVSSHVIEMPDGKEERIYIKRQENYTCSSWRAPISGIPTFEREFLNWKRFQEAGINTYELLYYAERRQGKDRQAILVSRALPAVDLVTYLSGPKKAFKQKIFQERRAVAHEIALVLRKMHDAGFRHGHLSPKHVFVGGTPDHPKIYLIDMEVARKVWRIRPAIIKDLGQLAKHTPECSRTERMRFFLDYLKESRLSSSSKRLWRAISKISNPA